MEKALELMPNGIVSVWTHKAILPEVVSIMHGLGKHLSQMVSCRSLFLKECGIYLFFLVLIANRLSICREFGVVQDGAEQLRPQSCFALLSNNQGDSPHVQKGKQHTLCLVYARTVQLQL